MRKQTSISLLISLLTALALPSAIHAGWVYVPNGPTPGPAYGPAYPRPGGAALGPWKWNFNFGGGPTSVVGGQRQRLESGWNFNFGGGYNFTPRAGFTLEFGQSVLGLSDEDIQRHQADDGDASVWSVTLNPVYRFRLGGPVGMYLIGGGGFYQRELRYFSSGFAFVPTLGGGGFYAPVATEAHDIDNTGGINAGMGFTFHVGGGAKFFVEARYHYVFTANTPTQIIPVTIGFRW
jgi:opacity protein-like surface antigen